MGVTTRSGNVCFVTGEGCENNDDSGGDNGGRGDSGDVRGSTGGEGGWVSHFSKSDSEEKRGGGIEVGIGSRASSAVSSIYSVHISIRCISGQLIIKQGRRWWVYHSFDWCWRQRLGRCAWNRSWSGRSFCRNMQTRRHVKSNQKFNERRRRRSPRLLNPPPSVVVVTRHEHQ